MTLVEFLAPLKKGTHQERVLAVLYYKERYEQVTSLSVDDIRQSLKGARASGWKKVNISDVLNKSGELVDTGGVYDRKRLWMLTDSGREHVRSLLGLPAADIEIEHDVGSLEQVIAGLKADDVRHYLEEGVKCLQVGALRACVVFVWTGAIREIQSSMINLGAAAVSAAVRKHDPKARQIKRIDDFAYVKDSIALQAAVDLGVLDKNEKDTLVDALGLRNRCGHPSRYRPGIKKVSAFVEDIVSIVFA